MISSGFLNRPKFHGLLPVASATVLAATLSVACGTAANPPPIATVEPTGTVPTVPTVAPPSTVAPASEVAPAQAQASTFVLPIPRPTRTPIPRAEGDMTQPVLYGHTATLLEDGGVLVTGGQTTITSRLPPPGVASAEIYYPSTGRWSATGPMLEPRTLYAAVLLEDGKVLVSGGFTEEYELHPASADVT